MDYKIWRKFWIFFIFVVSIQLSLLSASDQRDIFVKIPKRGDIPTAKLFVRLFGKKATEKGFESKRPVIVLIHGFNGTGSEFYCVAKILSKHFNVIVPDLRGFGRSDQPEIGYSTQIFADDLEVLVREFGIKKFNLLGFSIGGLIAQEYVIQYPHRIKKLILADTTPQFVATADFPFGLPLPEFEAIQALFAADFFAGVATIYAQAFEGGVCSGPKVDKLMSEALNLGLQPSPLAFDQWLADLATFSTVSRLSSIKAPTLILEGENDASFPPVISAFLHQQIAGSLYRILPGQPHINFLLTYKVYARLIKKFLLNKEVPVPKEVVCNLCTSIENHP